MEEASEIYEILWTILQALSKEHNLTQPVAARKLWEENITWKVQKPELFNYSLVMKQKFYACAYSYLRPMA